MEKLKPSKKARKQILKEKWAVEKEDFDDSFAVRRVLTGWVIGKEYICQQIAQGTDGGKFQAEVISKVPEMLNILMDCKRSYELNRNGGCNGEGREPETGSPYAKILELLNSLNLL